LPRIAIIGNPRSRGHLEGHASLGVTAQGLPQAAPESRAALREALAGFAAAGVELLVINGGDGTLREVLTALPESFGARPPAIAPLAAGRTNLAARILADGTTPRGEGEAVLARLLESARAGRLRRRAQPVLEIAFPGAPERGVLRGLLFGAAAMTEATQLAQAQIHRRGLNDALGVAATGLVTAAQVLTGRGALGRSLRQGTPMRLAVDDAPPREGPRFILLATPLDKLMLGLWPFWGEGAGPLRWLDVAAPPPRLASGLWSLLRRRAPTTPGWHSGRATRLVAALEQPFILDGEMFDSAPGGLVITTSAPVTFVAP
jgi:hypothetical protein